MLRLKIQCCVLCGHALFSQVGEEQTDHLKREGLHISIAHYPRGFAARFAERLRFHREVCAGCGETLRVLLEPAIRFIHDREAGR
jgi:hypothetical protein